VPAGEADDIQEPGADAAPGDTAAPDESNAARAGSAAGSAVGDGAATIGGDTNGTTSEQLGNATGDGNSPVALMLLIVGLVLTVGGGVTAFILLRRS
jgi:hypothetical protein